MARESAECAAYFIAVSQAPDLDVGTKDRFRGDARLLIALSTKLSSEKLARARAHLASRAMLRELGGDWGNVSMLDDKYGSPCKALVAGPKMQYWSDKRE
jgi:hypothetical protein